MGPSRIQSQPESQITRPLFTPRPQGVLLRAGGVIHWRVVVLAAEHPVDIVEELQRGAALQDAPDGM
eukprot:12451050-Alexandrium_andersonii.AAC.1